MIVRSNGRTGTVLPLVAISLVALIAIIALVIDVGILLCQRRQNQATADAAALAAADVLYTNYPKAQGRDEDGSARAAALALALDNGHPNDGTVSVVEVYIPPVSGAYAGQDGYVEVVVTYYQRRFFSNIFATGPLPVRARAVARGAWVPYHAGIIVLEQTDKGAVSVRGNGSLTDVGAPIVVNSSSPSAVLDQGGGTITAPELIITGNYTATGGGVINAQIQTGVPPTPDPLNYLPAPGESGAPPIPPAGTLRQTALPGGGSQYDLYPGSFSNLPNFGKKDVVIFHQDSNPTGGIYYLTAGGLNAQGANLMMAPGESGGMVIYNAGTGMNDKIIITGAPGGVVNLTSRSTGPYEGLILFQARNSSADVQIEGNGSFQITGTLYAPNALLKATGTGAVSAIGSQLLARELLLGGNGNIAVKYSDQTVARTRIICLVE